MGGGQSSAAPRFDAAGTSKAQTESNVNTGIANALLSNTNQVTPWGSLNYTQTGTTNIDGHDVPSFTATQTLDPQQQGILNRTNNLQVHALDAALPLIRRVGDTVGTSLNFNNAPGIRGSGGIDELSGMAKDSARSLFGLDSQGLRDRAYSALKSRSDIDLARAREGEQVQLANQGIAPGSEAWRRAMEGQDRALVDSSNQAFINAGNIASQDAGIATSLAGARGNALSTAGNLEGAGFNNDLTRRNQYINETQTLRNSPLQDYQAVLGMGGGVQQPNFITTPQGQIPMTDVTSPAMAEFQGRMNAWNNQQQNSNATAGGLFGLGGSILGGVARALPYGKMFGF